MNILDKHQRRDLTLALLGTKDVQSIPERIFIAQIAFDEADKAYQARLTELTLKAYSEARLPPKKEGEPKRVASNDDERKLAIQITCRDDETFRNLAQAREDAQRVLQYERNCLEAARIIARLVGEGGQ